MRVVLDTNIYVSAFTLPGSRSDEALRLAALGRYELVVSPAILVELANVLTRKFRWERARVVDACRVITDIATAVVRPSVSLAVFNDDPDNRIVECALAGETDRIVTGDRHMLQHREFQSIRIVSLADFLTEL